MSATNVRTSAPRDRAQPDRNAIATRVPTDCPAKRRRVSLPVAVYELFEQNQGRLRSELGPFLGIFQDLLQRLISPAPHESASRRAVKDLLSRYTMSPPFLVMTCVRYPVPPSARTPTGDDLDTGLGEMPLGFATLSIFSMVAGVVLLLGHPRTSSASSFVRLRS